MTRTPDVHASGWHGRVMADDECRTAAASIAREMSLMPTAADHVPTPEATGRV